MKTVYLLSESPASLLVRLDFPPIQQDVKCDLSWNLSVSLSWGLPSRGPHDSCQVSPSLKLCAPPAHKEAVSPGCHHQPSAFSLSKEVWSWGPLRDSGQCVVHSLPPPAVRWEDIHEANRRRELQEKPAASLPCLPEFGEHRHSGKVHAGWSGQRKRGLSSQQGAYPPRAGRGGLVFQARQGLDRRSQSGVDLEGFGPGRPPEGPIWPQGGMDISFRVRKE